MAYRELDEKGVIDYVKSRPVLKDILPEPDKLKADEVGDGNLNMVFIIQNPDDPVQSVILKQALPYLRVAGDSWPLTRERMRFETQALLKHNELAPGLVPIVFDHDEEMSVVVMEYLSKHEIMRKPLVNRQRFPGSGFKSLQMASVMREAI